MQLVYEFGAKEIEPVVETIRRAISTAPYWTECMSNDSDTYQPTNDSLASAALKLQEDLITSFSLHPADGLIRYGLVTCPFFAGQQRSFYMGTLEYLGDDYTPLWTLILAVPGLEFACLGFEEGVELNDDALCVERFPWEEWPLVVGALREQTGGQQWIIRQGPEMTWFSKQLNAQS